MATYYATLPNQVPHFGDHGYTSHGSYTSLPPAGQGVGNFNEAGFTFKKRFERIDWKKIASTDIDSISRNLDFHTLQGNIMNITFCNIEAEIDVRMMDPNFIKLFKLAQLTIEYLLHSQDYLSELVGGLEGKLKKALEEHEETKKLLEKNNQDLSELKKECHKRKKMLMAQQQILQAGSNSYNKCPYCNKAFVNITFLQSHLTRRHPEVTNMYNSMVGSQIQQQEQPQQQPQQQQQYSQSLPVTTQPPEKPSHDPPEPQITHELQSIKERLRLTERQLLEEQNARNADAHKEKEEREERQREREEVVDRWKEEQNEQQKAEVEQMRTMYMKE